MSDMGLDDAGGQLDMQMAAAAMLADNKDVKMMLRVLGKNLHDTIGDQVEIVHASSGLLHHQTEEIKEIKVHLGEDDYQAHLDGHAVRCTISRSSGGIQIRNEQLSVEQWLHRLLSALQVAAADNQGAQAALQSVILGGPS